MNWLIAMIWSIQTSLYFEWLSPLGNSIDGRCCFNDIEAFLGNGVLDGREGPARPPWPAPAQCRFLAAADDRFPAGSVPSLLTTQLTAIIGIVLWLPISHC